MICLTPPRHADDGITGQAGAPNHEHDGDRAIMHRSEGTVGTREVRLLAVLCPLYCAAARDLNPDGRTDITWFNADTNMLEVWRMDENLENGFRIE